MRSTHMILFLLLLVLAAPVAAQTTEVQVIRYASDGTTVASQVTHDVAWMESNLPVFGDGVTPYLFQGPIVNAQANDPAKWNPAEDINIDKVNETIKGTYLKDLCNLVGGMQPGGEVKLSASDGFSIRLGYDNVVAPLPRQGPPVLAWWTARENYGYQNGIRLFFGADNSTNPYGLHVFGHEDMRQTMDEKYWGWYGGKDNLPSAAQISNRYVAKVEIYPAPSTVTVTTTPTPTPTQTVDVQPWTLKMSGYTDFTVTSDYFYEGLACGGHTKSYIDANGVEWMGMPLWRLIGLVDDQLGHEVLIGAYNETLADLGYNVTVVASDGFSKTFTSQEVKRPANNQEYIDPPFLVACKMNDSALPEQVNGKFYWPLKLVGTSATGGKSVGNITEIRLTDLPIASPAGDKPWTLKLSGYTNFTVTSDYFAQGIACGHSGSYTDVNNVQWAGMPLWRLIGLVDDQVGHENLSGAYNDILADQGYSVTVIAGDGYSKTFTSQEIKRSANYLVASRMNGAPLPEQIDGKNYGPLKLVGANATGGKSIGNMVEIRLTNLPLSPTPTPTTPTAGASVLFDGDLDLKDGTFVCTAYNSGTTYQIQNLTPNGALELAAKAGNFGYNVTDKKMGTMGTMLLDRAGGYNLDSGNNRAWAYRINNVIKNDFSSTEGISVYRLADGDLVEFYYGTKGGAYEDAVAVIRARVHIRQQTTVFDGSVTLVNGTFGAYAYNSGETIPVNNLTVHGALEAASGAGNFAYRATDKKWSTMGTFLLDGVSTFDFNKTENTAWAYTLNGAAMNDYSADQGISVQPVKNGDQIVFFFGVKGAGLDAASAVVRVRVFVANDGDFSLALHGAQNASFAKADFDTSVDRVAFTDVSGTWSGIPLWRFAGIVDDADASSFNDALAGANYTIRVSAGDGYNKSLGSVQAARSGDFIVADRLNGAPLPETMWPLRLVGAAVPPHLSVAKLAQIELLDLPEAPPIGGDVGYFLVSTTPGAAEVYLEDISGTRYHTGNTGAGPLNVTVYLTATPMAKLIANLTGYSDAIYTITRYPGRGETLPIDLTLTQLPLVTPTPTVIGGNMPYPEPHIMPGRVQAEDYDQTAGYPAYSDTTPLNEGGAYRNDGVDIEVGGSGYNVGWIRPTEFLTYSVDVPAGQAGAYTLTFRLANPSGTKTFQVLVDGQSIGTMTVPATGSFTTWKDVTGPSFSMTGGRHVIKVDFPATTSINFDYMTIQKSTGPIVTPTVTSSGDASISVAPTSARPGDQIRFMVTPMAGKTIRSAWWTFDMVGHYGTWNSREVNPSFFYPKAGTYTPLVKLIYTDGSTQTVERTNAVVIR